MFQFYMPRCGGAGHASMCCVVATFGRKRRCCFSYGTGSSCSVVAFCAQCVGNLGRCVSCGLAAFMLHAAAHLPSTSSTGRRL